MIYLIPSVALTIYQMVVNSELEEDCKGVAMAEFEPLSQHLPGGTEDDHKKSRSG
jgi:hypothetical protein